MKNTPQITSGKNSGALIQVQSDFPDTMDNWLAAYFRFEVTTSASSQKIQKRDLGLFLDFMMREEKNLERTGWTPRLSKAFLDWLRQAMGAGDTRRWGDRTINRMIAHLKTFSKWIHKLRPFPLGDPMAKLKSQAVGTGLEVDRALTPGERRRLLDAADQLPMIGGLSRDRRRYKRRERPRRKSFRPWRNRAMVYALIETGMRRAEVARLNLAGVDFDKRVLQVQVKGENIHGYKISRQGLAAIKDYLDNERAGDDKERKSPALFLPAKEISAGKGRLSPRSVSSVWADTCAIAQVEGKSTHSARHAMGKYIMERTGNVAAVQRQLGHLNPAYSMQYSRISDQELESVLDER